MVPAFLIAFGFGNVAMLGWLAAAAAPLLIHLWSRRRHREVPWAAVAFLLAAIRKNSRRIQLQQWLLLAVRTLILVLVIVAVAEPYGQHLGGDGVGVPTHHVLVIDTSFSMAYRQDESTRLAKAKALAAELIAGSGPTDAFTVITLADPPRQLIGRDSADRAAVSAQIDALVLSNAGADLAATLDLVVATLNLDARDRDRFGRQTVDFITDVQRVTWQPNSLPLPAGEGIKQLAALAKQASLQMHDVGSPRATNLAVTGLRSSAPFITAGREVTFDATLHEFGARPQSKCVVEFLVDDVPAGEQTVDVPAGGDAVVRFIHRFRTAGSHAVAVRASGDRLEIDNSRWLAVDVGERVNVLVVAGRPDDATYIASALDPDQSDESAIRPRVITEGELAEVDLAPYDCIFLSNVAQLTSNEAARLGSRVADGAGLVVFVGDRVRAESYNALADASGGNKPPLFPIKLGELIAGAQFGLDPRDYRHSIVAPFRGQERAGLLSTPVAKYFRLEMPKDRADVDVALAIRNGDPLAVTAPLGRGRVVFVATAGSLASVDVANGEPWTAWPAWPSFLPVVREMLSYSVGGQQTARQTTVGHLLNFTSPTSGGDSLELIRPDGHRATLRAIETSAGREWTYADTDLAGVYTIPGKLSEDAVRFAVNVDTRESDLTQVDPQKLPPELKVHNESAGGAVAGRDVLPRAPWNRSLLWTALSLLFVELCLAWVFGRGAS